VRLPLELKDAPRVVYEPPQLADGPDGVPRPAVVG
jgi:hypothetical protein